MSREITIQAAAVNEYRDGALQTGETVRMGTQYFSGAARYHDVVLVLDLPQPLEKLTLEQTWRGHEGGAAGYTFSAALTQEERTTAPEREDLTYHFTGNTATVTFGKKLKKGRWYLWLWRHNGSAPSFVYGTRGTHPQLAITGVTADGGHVFRNGVWKAAAPKVYRNGVWRDAAPKEYRNGWGELT